jgi:hypothetical protein
VDAVVEAWCADSCDACNAQHDVDTLGPRNGTRKDPAIRAGANATAIAAASCTKKMVTVKEQAPPLEHHAPRKRPTQHQPFHAPAFDGSQRRTVASYERELKDIETRKSGCDRI